MEFYTHAFYLLVCSSTWHHNFCVCFYFFIFFFTPQNQFCSSSAAFLLHVCTWGLCYGTRTVFLNTTKLCVNISFYIENLLITFTYLKLWFYHMKLNENKIAINNSHNFSQAEKSVSQLNQVKQICRQFKKSSDRANLTRQSSSFANSIQSIWPITSSNDIVLQGYMLTQCMDYISHNSHLSLYKKELTCSRLLIYGKSSTVRNYGVLK